MRYWNNKYLIILILFIVYANYTNAEEIRLPILTLPDLSQWESRNFSGETRYQVVNLNAKPALEALSNGSASGLFRKIEVNLLETPYLHWSWRIENTFTNTDEKSRKGDDYPARVYIILSGGIFFWQTAALNYVWSSHQPVDSYWPNAYTGNAVMLAVQSGNKHRNRWVKERRNVLLDIKKYLGKDDATQVDAIAIMTDSDNTKGTAKAYYGNIYFSDK